MANKLYVFGIGGSGSRVIRALTMMLASGVKLGVDKIVPIIIDPDVANADLSDTVALMSKYNELRKELSFPEGSRSRFFKTAIERSTPNYTLPFENTNEKEFQDFVSISEMTNSTQAMMRMLFSEDNLNSTMEVGFKGNPNIGSVVLNQIFSSEGFTDFVNGFNQGDKIFIISSIFGGTGASGFPMLLKTLRESDRFNSSNIINKSNIGAVTILPYFKVESDPEVEQKVNSSTFISKTKSALAYYQNNIVANNQIDALYLIGDNPNTTYKYSEGGSTQKNDPHLIEFLAASAIVDFSHLPYRDAEEDIQSVCYELGIKDTPDSVDFTKFYDGLKDMLYYPLTQFTLMSLDLKNDESFNKTNLAATQNMQDFYTGNFYKRLKKFTEEYTTWLECMAKCNRSLNLYNLDCGRNPFDLVNGVKAEKSIWAKVKIGKDNYEFFEGKLNSVAQDAKKNLEGKEKQGAYFLELFYRATEKIIQEKLKL